MILNESPAVYLGSDSVEVIYLGSEKVWPSGGEYTPIDWIQATGTQYINTGYTQQSDSARIEANVHVYGGGNHAFIFGGYSVGAGVTWSSVVNVYFIWIYVNDARTATGDDGHDPYGASGDVELKIEVNPTAQTITENGVVKATGAGSDPSQNAQPYCIFARSDGSHLIGAKLYSFKIYDNDVLVRDFIPVVRNADGKPGLWDNVTRQFYINAGTGEFDVPT